MSGEERPLDGRVALVTGVSRRAGIGFAIARTLLDAGADVLIQSWTPHDAGHAWGADPIGMSGIIEELGGAAHIEADFSDSDAPRAVVERAVAEYGALDILVANHAHSSTQSFTEVTAAELDLAWAVNARASVLLAQAYAGARDEKRPGGRIVLFTSGQHLGPMGSEIAYAVSKGAIHQMTLSIADELADRGVTVNTVNPGPVDTGWADDELTRRVAHTLPAGRWGRPDDVARLVRFLVSDDGAWITGQVINSEGGFRRWQM